MGTSQSNAGEMTMHGMVGMTSRTIIATLLIYLSTLPCVLIGSLASGSTASPGDGMQSSHEPETQPDEEIPMEIGPTKEIVADMLQALRALDDHVKGVTNLDEMQIADCKSTIDSSRTACQMNHTAEIITAAFDLVTDYEHIVGPMFISEHTRGGFDRRNLPSDIHTVVVSVMQSIVDDVFTSETLAEYPSLLRGFRFQSADYFPGAAQPPTDPDRTHRARINASYPKTYGHRVMNDSHPARKPTGTYLAPGTIATVTVPTSIVGKGYGIRVGGSSNDLSRKPKIRRLDRSTVLYDIHSTETQIASPLGGGIHIEVPYLADAGIVEIQIRNAVRSPYFSTQIFDRTSLADWQKTERKHQAPWADFISEKVFIQVPTSWIYNFDDPITMLEDWDSAMDAVSDLMGFPRIRGKEVLYTQPDVLIRAGAYAPGYPQVNTTYDPIKDYGGNHNHYFLTGPQHSPAWELHEVGHGQLFQKFTGETEAVVNLLYVAVMHQKFGMSLDEAFYRSRRFDNPFRTLANTANAWMATENFKLERPMVTTEMQYQLKGHAKYVEIACLFGWEVLNRYWYSINEDHEVGIEVKGGRNSGDTDSLILRMARAAGVDVTPLIHFWGRPPDDVAATKAAIASEKLPASARIYDTLVQYKAAIPSTDEAFRAFAQNWWGKPPSPEGYMTEKYHAALWDSWDEAYATGIGENVQHIIDLYFPDGRPAASY